MLGEILKILQIPPIFLPSLRIHLQQTKQKITIVGLILNIKLIKGKFYQMFETNNYQLGKFDETRQICSFLRTNYLTLYHLLEDSVRTMGIVPRRFHSINLKVLTKIA